ncbi:MAG: ribonuclease G [Porticoccaceae bacterium]|nr:ribonuclease G [Porticoccaceae bacterium]
MKAEVLVNVAPTETRVARVENGVLLELAIERANKRSLVGNIYQGTVVRVMPGMQAAFVDIGLDKAGFIHANDVAHDLPVQHNLASVVARDQAGHQNNTNGNGNDTRPDIRQLLREGQRVSAQVMKEPIGTKGARLTTKLSVSSRYLVYMPGVDHIGISQRLDQEEERERLRSELELAIESGDMKEEGGGYIIRTVAEGVSAEELRIDLNYLHRLWGLVKERIKRVSAPNNIYQDLPLALRTLRDVAMQDVEIVRIDSRGVFKDMYDFAQRFCPELLNNIEYYEGPRPLFYLYGVEDEISKAMERKVYLKSGGHLVFDQTEAMTTVDVNTGGYVGRHNLEETILKTNLEAAGSIARQLRLRNLGGIIILDFIDMADPEHQRQVLRRLEKALENDRVKMRISGVSELGLVEMTRKRTSENLQQVLCEPCEVCSSRGYLKSAETISYDIMREILGTAKSFESAKVLVIASPLVIDRFLDEDASHVESLEKHIERQVEFRVESNYSQEQYDIIPVSQASPGAIVLE